MEMKVNWSGRGHRYTEEEVAVVTRVMQEADPLTQGKYQAEFEAVFSEFIGAKHSFAVSSCTAALELSAILCDLKAGDEVIIPAHTFAATAIPFARTGAKIVWADICPKTFVATAETIEAVRTQKTKAIVVVHLYGLACDMDPIMELAACHDIRVVEDAAQAPGGSYKERRLGSIGDFGCFSFHTHKNMTTLGEGGALTVNRDEDAKLTPGLRHNGMRAYTHERDNYWEPAMSNVDFDIDQFWPYNFCLGEVQCALATQLLKRVDQMNAERTRKAKRFIEALVDYPELSFQETPEGQQNVHHLMPARYENKQCGKNRNDFMKALSEKHGVKAVVQYYPLYRYPMFEKAGFGEADCPETDSFFDSMVSFPFHHWQSEEDFQQLIDRTKAALEDLR